jgi:pimeloyl-ACP methyl ester carboxylesterase
MPYGSAVDGFRLAYDRDGSGSPVLLLHGWPGDRGDFRDVVPLLGESADVVVPDLRGFGESDKHPEPPADGYSADAQARSLLGLMDELGLDRPVIGGYDIGSRIAQTIALAHPERVRAIVVSPPLPGAGTRVLSADAYRELWYQTFHRLDLADAILDGNRAAVRAYIEHFWSHWSGPGFAPSAAELDRLARSYGEPGAFTASIGWYRGGSGTVARSLTEQPPAPADRIAISTTVLWPEHDPLFPSSWGDRLDEFFSDVRVEQLPGCGHFVPLEAPRELAGAVLDCLHGHHVSG